MMKLGAQLFTLRDYTQNERDLETSLSLVAEMGYKTVQLSALGAIAPERIKALCDKYSLSIVLTHTDPLRIINDTEAVIREHEFYGCDYIGIGAMPPKYRSPHWLPHFKEDFLPAAERIAKAGKLLMYHNHNIEFERFGGKLIMETLMEDFPPDTMGFTLDTYWVQMGGGDVCEWLTKLKGRTPCIHLKDMAVKGWDPVMAPVGEGNMNFKKILDTCESLGGVKYLLVEQDTCEGSPFDCLKTSYENLKKLGYE